MAVTSPPVSPPVTSPAALALIVFSALFAFRRLGPLDFWWGMSACIALLIAFCFFLDKSYLRLLLAEFRSGLVRKIVLGILSALLLYGIFYLGEILSSLIFPSARSGISDIYRFKNGASVLRIFLLLVFLIGPGEEVFWRGYLQRHGQRSLGPWPGFILSVGLYTAVHIASGNPMLILAAFVCGLYWGALFAVGRSVLLVAVSHTAWDLLAFILRPF